MSAYKIKENLITSSETLADGETFTSDLINLEQEMAEGSGSLHIITTGAGTLKMELLQTNDGGLPAIAFNDVDDIVTAHSAGSAGYAMPTRPISAYEKVLCTATGAVVITNLVLVEQ